jgi:hypothetical protein
MRLKFVNEIRSNSAQKIFNHKNQDMKTKPSHFYSIFNELDINQRPINAAHQRPLAIKQT